MSIRHLFGREDIYVIHANHARDRGEPWWRGSKVSLHDDAHKVEASVEWTLFSQHGFGYGFQFGRNGSESDVGLDLYLGRLSSVWLRLRSPWTKWANIAQSDTDRHWCEPRHTGFRLFRFDGSWVEFQFEGYGYSWSRDDEWWRDWHFGPTEFWGRRSVETIEEATGETVVPLPEGSYAATWTKKRYVRRHVRFPGTVRDRIMGAKGHTSIDLKVEGGIPHEGKGENSWDCGMDGLFEISGKSVEDAVANAVRSTLMDGEFNRSSRQRHGSGRVRLTS